ncbi:MAG: hypothetical protein HC904_09080 [Blastochloris sp.]|nr:hypothetical protein [Blastochloris sp.]
MATLKIKDPEVDRIFCRYQDVHRSFIETFFKTPEGLDCLLVWIGKCTNSGEGKRRRQDHKKLLEHA